MVHSLGQGIAALTGDTLLPDGLSPFIDHRRPLSDLAMVERRRSLKNENRRIVETYGTRPNYQGATQPVFRFRPSPIFFARADRWAA
jgi:hypothetical protein